MIYSTGREEKMSNAVLKESESAYPMSGVSNPTLQIIAQHSKIPVDRMAFDDCVLVFNSPYKINVRQENGYFIHEDPLLDMLCWGKTLEELFDAVFEEFNFLWRIYARAEDNDLDGSAVAVKNVLWAIAKEGSK
jgi:hypothetical protein